MLPDQFDLHVEAIIFCASEPISAIEIQMGLQDYYEVEISSERILQSIENLIEKFQTFQINN